MLLNVPFDVPGAHVLEKMEVKAEWSELGSQRSQRSFLIPAVSVSPPQESYVWKMYQERCWDFFPTGDCFRKQYEDQLG